MKKTRIKETMNILKVILCLAIVNQLHSAEQTSNSSFMRNSHSYKESAYDLIKNPRLALDYHKSNETCSPTLLLRCIMTDYGLTQHRTRYQMLPILAPILVKSGADVDARVQKGPFDGCNYEELLKQLIKKCYEGDAEQKALQATLEAIKKSHEEVVAYKDKRRVIIQDLTCDDLSFLIEEYEDPSAMTNEDYERVDEGLKAVEKAKNEIAEFMGPNLNYYLFPDFSSSPGTISSRTLINIDQSDSDD